MLQVLKMAEKCSQKLVFPECAPSLFRLLLGEAEEGTVGPICILMNTVEPTEAVAECMQEIATKCTEISSCSEHFALATALNKDFNRFVEDAMRSGLDVIQTIASMLMIESHASDCLSKMKSSRTLVIQDEEVHDIVVEMMLTVIRYFSSDLHM